MLVDICTTWMVGYCAGVLSDHPPAVSVDLVLALLSDACVNSMIPRDEARY